MSKAILIAYFSRSGNNYVNGSIMNLSMGNTEAAANKIKKMTDGDLFKINPVKKYFEDYRVCTEEAQHELHTNVRPELAEKLESIDGYDTVILGYPNCGVPCPCWSVRFWRCMTFPARPFYRYAPMKAAAWEKARQTFKSSVQVRM
jgi:flavodoxin